MGWGNVDRETIDAGNSDFRFAKQCTRYRLLALTTVGGQVNRTTVIFNGGIASFSYMNTTLFRFDAGINKVNPFTQSWREQTFERSHHDWLTFTISDFALELDIEVIDTTTRQLSNQIAQHFCKLQVGLEFLPNVRT